MTRARRTILATTLALSLTLWGARVDAKGEKTAKVALTFDDLPALTLTTNQAYVNDLTTRLLAGLRRHHLPATGFVVESKLDEGDRAQQIAALEKWLDAGMDLGNHTYSHESPNEIGADAYVADIAMGEVVTKKLLAARGRKITWFRFPYLESGETTAVRDQIQRWLKDHHYRNAPVTMNADDWEFAEPYDDAIAHKDEARRQHIREEYLHYTDQMMAWYRKAAHVLFGRDIAYVMLMHGTRLNADCIDDLAGLMKKNGLRGISLARAMRDPAYKIPDTYVGKEGVDWIERWSLAMGMDNQLPWASYADPPKDIQAGYDKVDKDRDEPDQDAAEKPKS